MRIRWRAVAKAVAILVFLTVIPVVGQRYIPAEALRFLSSQSAFDLIALLDRIALIGVAFAALVLLKGHMEKASARQLVLSMVSKAFWFFIVLFMLGVGDPWTGGVAVLGGSSAGAQNIVEIDLRLFAILTALILALMAVRSVLQYQEGRKAQVTVTQTESSLQP